MTHPINRIAELLPHRTNVKLALLWIAMGKQDAGLERSRQFVEVLKQDQIRHTYVETDGGHVWAVWRWCLGEFAPLLFKKPAT